jgi:hypothetical protein
MPFIPSSVCLISTYVYYHLLYENFSDQASLPIPCIKCVPYASTYQTTLIYWLLVYLLP